MRRQHTLHHHPTTWYDAQPPQHHAAQPTCTERAPNPVWRALAAIGLVRGDAGTDVPLPTGMMIMLVSSSHTMHSQHAHAVFTDKLQCHQAHDRFGRVAPNATHRPVVLVSCGSFNPPTNMHLRMFELAATQLAKVWRVGHRLIMCRTQSHHVSNAVGHGRAWWLHVASAQCLWQAGPRGNAPSRQHVPPRRQHITPRHGRRMGGTPSRHPPTPTMQHVHHVGTQRQAVHR